MRPVSLVLRSPLAAVAGADALCRDGVPVVAVGGAFGLALAYRCQSSLDAGTAFALWLACSAPAAPRPRARP